jgi:hypothetical protein
MSVGMGHEEMALFVNIEPRLLATGQLHEELFLQDRFNRQQTAFYEGRGCRGNFGYVGSTRRLIERSNSFANPPH